MFYLLTTLIVSFIIYLTNKELTTSAFFLKWVTWVYPSLIITYFLKNLKVKSWKEQSFEKAEKLYRSDLKSVNKSQNKKKAGKNVS